MIAVCILTKKPTIDESNTPKSFEWMTVNSNFTEQQPEKRVRSVAEIFWYENRGESRG
jgi:hypothetical protein